MKLKGYLVISPKDGDPLKGWVISSCAAAIPNTIGPRSRVAEVILEVPDDVVDLPRINIQWPTGEVPDEVLKEVKDWTDG